MQWNVERLSNMNEFRGNPRFRQPEHTTVEADTLDIEGGTLIFKNGEDLVAAYGSGAWASVTQAEPTG